MPTNLEVASDSMWYNFKDSNKLEQLVKTDNVCEQ